jgi:hypothetical protein
MAEAAFLIGEMESLREVPLPQTQGEVPAPQTQGEVPAPQAQGEAE